MKSLMDCLAVRAADERLNLAMQRLQIIDKYIAEMQLMVLERGQHIQKLIAEGNTVAEQDFMRAVSDSMEIMQLYRQEILTFITEFRGPRAPVAVVSP